MSRPILYDPCNPDTRTYLREALRSLPIEGPPLIRVIKQAREGIEGEKRALGVLPASFNPPTVSHQSLAREAAQVVELDELLLILDQKAEDKDLSGAPLEDRLLMLLALFGDDPHVSLGISNRGLFVEKIEALRDIYPPDTQIYFIVGYDTMVRIFNPRYYDDREKSLHELFSLARFLVANRGDCDQRDLEELFRREENRPFAPRVLPIRLPPPLWPGSPPRWSARGWRTGTRWGTCSPPRLRSS